MEYDLSMEKTKLGAENIPVSRLLLLENYKFNENRGEISWQLFCESLVMHFLFMQNAGYKHVYALKRPKALKYCILT